MLKYSYDLFNKFNTNMICIYEILIKSTIYTENVNIAFNWND
jgi:hypothetical protein